MAVTVKPKIESTHFTMVVALRQVFQDCLDFDARHILPNSVGNHVVMIQNALIRIEGDKIKPVEREALDKEIAAKKYDKMTRALVLRFKKDRDIKREGRDFDDVVGRMTIDRLDTEMKKLEGKAEEVKVVSQDVLIRILGQDPTAAAAGTETTEGQAFIGIPSPADLKRKIETSDYLKTHFPIEIINFNGGHEKRGTDPNPAILNRFGLVKANVSRLAKPAGMEDAVASMGRIAILGWSSGGRNAVALSRALKPFGNDVDYVGLADAAFDDRADPLIALGAQTRSGDSFYQAATNILTSEGFEFHAAASGTSDGMLDLTDPFYVARKAAFLGLTFKTDDRRDKFFEDCHERAVKDGYQRIEATALGLFR